MRAANKATNVTSQLPIEHWHAWIGDATIANAILDRIMQKNHRFNLTGESLRPNVQTTILRLMPKSLAAARSLMASTMTARLTLAHRSTSVYILSASPDPILDRRIGLGLEPRHFAAWYLTSPSFTNFVTKKFVNLN
jgi:hypothetical protein